MDKIREQIKALRDLGPNHCYEYPEATEAADTMEAMLEVVEAAQNIDNLWGSEGLSNLPADIALMDTMSEALAKLEELT